MARKVCFRAAGRLGHSPRAGKGLLCGPMPLLYMYCSCLLYPGMGSPGVWGYPGTHSAQGSAQRWWGAAACAKC